MTTRHTNHGLRKVCRCPRRAWPKCTHPWHFNYKPRHGQAYRFSLDHYLRRRIATKEEAKREANAIRTAIDAGTFRVTGTTEAAAAPSTADAVTLTAFGGIFLERYSKARGKKTWTNDQFMLHQLTSWRAPDAAIALGEKAIGAITEDDLELFVQHVRATRAASTGNQYVQLVKALFRWATKKGYLARNPISADTEVLTRQKIARRSRRVAADEETRLLHAANPRLQRLIIAALETGCRRGELLALQWRDVDLDAGELRIRAETAKDAEERVLPISARLDAVLKMANTDPAGHAFGPEAFVFGDEVGRRIVSVKRTWALATEAARVADLHFHDLRHEAGSRLLEAGWPLHHVRDMLGHADVSTTDTYLNATRLTLRESMRRSDELRARCKLVANEAENAPPLPCNDVATNSRKSLVN